jgi:hypothetical protein
VRAGLPPRPDGSGQQVKLSCHSCVRGVIILSSVLTSRARSHPPPHPQRGQLLTQGERAGDTSGKSPTTCGHSPDTAGAAGIWLPLGVRVIQESGKVSRAEPDVGTSLEHARPGLGFDRVPDRVCLVLRRVRRAELVARGSDRRIAYRLTRELIGGAVAVGYTTAALADCLRMSAPSVKSRTSPGGWLSSETVQQIAGVGADTIAAWREATLLIDHRSIATGEVFYTAAEVMHAISLHGRDT